MGKASTKAQNKYIAKTYDRINIAVPKGRKATLEARAAERGQSITAYLTSLVLADMGMTKAEWKAEE